MTLPADEFIRRFPLHVLPDGFLRIRHYGLFASAVRAVNIERIRAILAKEEAGPARGARPVRRDDTIGGRWAACKANVSAWRGALLIYAACALATLPLHLRFHRGNTP